MMDRSATRTLILASRSPRRARLLTQAGYVFVQSPLTTPEPPLPAMVNGQTAEQVALDIAEFKLVNILRFNKLKQFISPVLLVADTIIRAPDGALLGQPSDLDHARTMLRSLIGKTHHVITAVVMTDTDTGSSQRIVDRAAVRIGELPTGVLEDYLSLDRWRGKAGGYDLAEVQGRWPIDVEGDGDPTTVIGLPMRKLVPALARWAIQPHQADDA